MSEIIKSYFGVAISREFGETVSRMHKIHELKNGNFVKEEETGKRVTYHKITKEEGDTMIKNFEEGL